MTEPKGPGPGRAATIHDRATEVLSLAMVVIGVALAAQLTALRIVLGLLFLAAGVGRLYVGARIRRRRRDRSG